MNIVLGFILGAITYAIYKRLTKKKNHSHPCGVMMVEYEIKKPTNNTIKPDCNIEPGLDEEEAEKIVKKNTNQDLVDEVEQNKQNKTKKILMSETKSFAKSRKLRSLGYSVKEIAKLRGLSEITVKSHFWKQ